VRGPCEIMTYRYFKSVASSGAGIARAVRGCWKPDDMISWPPQQEHRWLSSKAWGHEPRWRRILITQRRCDNQLTHSAIFQARAPLAKRSYLRLRCRPQGRAWKRKRRMSSSVVGSHDPLPSEVIRGANAYNEAPNLHYSKSAGGSLRWRRDG
jgi:hypothetical protein